MQQVKYLHITMNIKKNLFDCLYANEWYNSSITFAVWHIVCGGQLCKVCLNKGLKKFIIILSQKNYHTY